MLKRLLLAGAAIAALAGPARAANTALIMWNGADPLGFEAATGTGSADLTATNLDGVTVTLSFVSRTTGPNDLTEGNINIDNTTGSVQTLMIIAGANGFAGPSDGFKLTGTIGATLGSSDLVGAFFADGSNTLNGQTESVVGVTLNGFDSGLLTGTDSFSFNGFGADAVAGPYGLAEELTLTLQPGASVFVQGLSMEATAIPEPRTWILSLIGFVSLALMAAVRRRKTAFYASL